MRMKSITSGETGAEPLKMNLMRPPSFWRICIATISILIFFFFAVLMFRQISPYLCKYQTIPQPVVYSVFQVCLLWIVCHVEEIAADASFGLDTRQDFVVDSVE